MLVRYSIGVIQELINQLLTIYQGVHITHLIKNTPIETFSSITCIWGNVIFFQLVFFFQGKCDC